MKIKLFYSYSHRDEDLKEELKKHLSLLKRQGILEDWNFRDINAGSEWENEIDRNLGESKIILLLVSPDFMASEYCYSKEMKKAMDLHKLKKAKVIPVILREVDWQNAPFGQLTVLPTNSKAVKSWNNRDKAFLDIAKGIREACSEIARGKNSVKGKQPNNAKVARVKVFKPQKEGHYYCSKCGIEEGGPPSNCLGSFSDLHNFVFYKEYVFCSRCGIKPGNKTKCVTLYVAHYFKGYEGPVYCSNCGVEAGERSVCRSIGDLFAFTMIDTHNFSVNSNKIHCSKCGTRPGKKTKCIGIDERHDFREPSDKSNSLDLPTLW